MDRLHPIGDASPTPVRTRSFLAASTKGCIMGIALLILILALIIGGVGLFVEALRWVLIIAVVLLIVGAFTGFRGRTRA